MTEAGIKKLATLRSLQSISIDPIVPTEAVQLNQLPSVRSIGLAKQDDAAVGPLSHLTRVAALYPGWNLTDEGARRLQKALPNAVILHKGVPPTEAERKAIQWALDQKALVTLAENWSGAIKEVPKDAVALAQIRMPDDGVKTGAAHLRGIRCIWSLSWPGLKNADEEAADIATLTSFLG